MSCSTACKIVIIAACSVNVVELSYRLPHDIFFQVIPVASHITNSPVFFEKFEWFPLRDCA